jgi:VIT1/CCC1 family predicted Fe2+/Mn2+ transporter
MTLSLATLFMLGIFLGRVAKGNWWFYGLMMLTAGAFAALIVFLIQLF